jgi:hypothetical protein
MIRLAFHIHLPLPLPLLKQKVSSENDQMFLLVLFSARTSSLL